MRSSRYGLVCLAAVAACLLLLLNGATSADAKVGHTTKSNVDPVDYKSQLLKKGYRISKRYNGGNCEGGSDIVKGAARCTHGNYIFDPCWTFRYSNTDYTGVVCLSAPWMHTLSEIKNASLDLPGTAGRTLWGLKLANGNKCRQLDGAVDRYRGKFLEWGCSHNVGLLQQPNRSKRVWTIKEVKYSDGHYHSAGTARIAHAWFGTGQ